jgi:hypothetical protein
MQRLKPVRIDASDIEVMEQVGRPLEMANGSIAQGFRPLADDDDRYFERVTSTTGKVEWLQLTNGGRG